MLSSVLINRQWTKPEENPIEIMLSVLDQGHSLILFPEGTRNQTETPLQPFKSGLYHLAQQQPDFELVPVWIANLNRVMPKGEFIPVPLICTVAFGAPLRLAEGESKEAFLQRASNALLALSSGKASE